MEEGVNFFRRGRQTDQIKSCPSNQSSLVGRQRGLEMLFFQPRKNKAVDSGFRPGSILYARRQIILHGLKGPEFSLLGRNLEDFRSLRDFGSLGDFGSRFR